MRLQTTPFAAVPLAPPITRARLGNDPDHSHDCPICGEDHGASPTVSAPSPASIVKPAPDEVAAPIKVSEGNAFLTLPAKRVPNTALGSVENIIAKGFSDLEGPVQPTKTGPMALIAGVGNWFKNFFEGLWLVARTLLRDAPKR